MEIQQDNQNKNDNVNILTANKADTNHIDVEQLNYLVNNKIDSRNYVDYTFVGTNAELIAHKLGRIPKGYMILSKDKNATIYGDISIFTKTRASLACSSAGTKARILFL